jgi:hypothetical protein
LSDQAGPAGRVSTPAVQLEERLREALGRDPERAGSMIHPPMLPRERAWRKLANGVPLLHLEEVAPDLKRCLDRFGRLLVLAESVGVDPEAAHAIGEALRDGRLDFERGLGEALAGHDDHLTVLAGWSGLEPTLLTALLDLVAEPALRALAAAFEPLLGEPERWRRNYCPVCGGWPLEEPAGVVQPASMRCRRCGCRWQFGGELADRESDAHRSAWPAGSGFRIELGEGEPDEVLEALMEVD